MSLGNVLGAAAPIAAGYFGGPLLAGSLGATGGAVAAGALTGAGIAALSGQDILTGGITGGLGGMGGGAFRGAADATKLAAAGAGGGTTAGVNAMAQAPLTGSAEFISPYTTTGVPGIQTAAPGLAGGTGSTLGQAGQYAAAANAPMYTGPTAPNFKVAGNIGSPSPNFNAVVRSGGGYDPTLKGTLDRGIGSISEGLDSASAAFDGPGKFLENLGEGDKVMGAGKLALTSSGPIMAGLEPEYETFEEMRGDKYDPTRRLNLDEIDTGIGAALNRDTGLRLLAGGGYLETGGRVGDGMSDDIKATINNEQEARLSDGEFVVPADVVSHLGNGSSDAGAKRLYDMMDKIRQARTGTIKQGREINPERYMPA